MSSEDSNELVHVDRPGRKPTAEEAEAILTLVRGGWLRLELTVDDARPAPHRFPCSTDGCPGDGRYVPPGRGHVEGCTALPSVSDGSGS